MTRILRAMEEGDPHAARQLLPLVYDELRRLAAHQLARETPGHTLQPTALVHEAYLRLVGSADPQQAVESSWDHRGHFFAAAAEAMRRILVESARRKARPKHGGDRRRVAWEEVTSLAEATPEHVVDLDEALTRLAELDPMRAEVVKLRFFAGLTMPEAAQSLGVSLATAERYWTFARTWLYAELSDVGETTRP